MSSRAETETDTTTEQPAEEASPSVDYVEGVRGQVVLALCPDSEDRQSLAVWKLGPTGQPNGAWVMRFGEPSVDADELAAVLRLVQGWGLVGWDVAESHLLLDRLSDWLPAELLDGLRSHVISIPSLVEEIREHRQKYVEALEQYRTEAKSKIAPLTWSQQIPSDTEAVRRVLTPAVPAGAEPVAAQALAVTGAVRRAAALWQDTEQVRYRRPVLRSFGEPQALPPRWLATLRAAAASTARSGSH